MTVAATALTDRRMTFDEIVAEARITIEQHGRVGLQYTRISDDPEGRELGVIAQAEDTTGLAEKEGVPLLSRPFEDNDLSASTLAKKPRPDYELMRKVVTALPRDSVIVYAYSNSRLTRRPVELEDWIKTYEMTGVLIHTVVSGKDDLSTAEGRMIARIKADIDAAEAEKTSERVTRRIRQLRESGIAGPGGKRAFGYERAPLRHDVLKVIEHEAEAIRKGAKILLSSGTTGDVLRQWVKDGIKPCHAERWSRSTIAGIYNSPRIAGLYLWDDEIKDAKNVPAILDREVWEAVVERLIPHDMSREPGYWTLNNLLTGVVQCGKCGHKMATKGPHYGCLSARGGCGGVFRKREWVDELVGEAMAKYFASLPKVVVESTDPGLRDEIHRLEALIVETMAQVSSGALPSEDGFPFVAKIRGDVKKLKVKQNQAVALTISKLPLDVAEESWNGDDILKKRHVLASTIQAVIIYPIGRGYGRWSPLPESSVEILWW